MPTAPDIETAVGAPPRAAAPQAVSGERDVTVVVIASEPSPLAVDRTLTSIEETQGAVAVTEIVVADNASSIPVRVVSPQASVVRGRTRRRFADLVNRAIEGAGNDLVAVILAGSELRHDDLDACVELLGTEHPMPVAAAVWPNNLTSPRSSGVVNPDELLIELLRRDVSALPEVLIVRRRAFLEAGGLDPALRNAAVASFLIECGATVAIGPVGSARSARQAASVAPNERRSIGELEAPATIIARFGHLLDPRCRRRAHARQAFAALAALVRATARGWPDLRRVARRELARGVRRAGIGALLREAFGRG